MKDQLSKIWDNTLRLIEEDGTLAKPSFETWLKDTRPLYREKETLFVEIPNEFARDWVESRYSGLIQRKLTSVVGEPWKVKFITPDEKPPEKPAPQAPKVSERLEEMVGMILNPKYVFESFVVGNSNRFAHAAALAVAEAPAKAYNPLFMYGGVGLGKTHLMHAIGHYVLEQKPHARVVYVSAEKFTNDMINSLRHNKMDEFRNRYRTVDVLLVDDIQFLTGKEGTQEEFFHTFNALYEASKQIIICSDRLPKEIATLEDRLRSRFEWGLTTDIQAPDLETRVAILRKKASIEGIEISTDVLLYIANQISSNIRELEGALVRVTAYSSLSARPIDVQMATEALREILPQNQTRPLSIELIQQTVAEYYDLRVSDMKAKKRTRAVAYPRQIAMYLARELTDSSLPKIGEEFGGRDHTTVIHAYEKIVDSLKKDEKLHKDIQNLMQRLQVS